MFWTTRNTTGAAQPYARHLPNPRDEECRQTPAPARTPLWETSDDVVRPYVLRP